MSLRPRHVKMGVSRETVRNTEPVSRETILPNAKVPFPRFSLPV